MGAPTIEEIPDSEKEKALEMHKALVEAAKKKAFALRVLFLFAVKIRQISLLIFINILIVYSYVNYF